MNRAQRRAAERAEARAPRATRRRGDCGHVLMPRQIERLVMPIHVALELLPLGLYTESHAHDLAAFLTVAQLAAEEAGREDLVGVGADGALVLIAMRDRVREGAAWNVTAAERERLMHCVLTLDRWYRSTTTTRWIRAARKATALADAALARGAGRLDLVTDGL
jgi:hypothetical protein